MKKTYKLKVAGLERDLPICQINEGLAIAAFIIFGDTELTCACASELNKIVPKHDIMITAEAKSIPLIHEMARQAGEKTYIIARKSLKVYMTDPVAVSVKSITTPVRQNLYITKEDALLMKDKDVLIVDDVISTGASIAAVESLVKTAGGRIVGKAAILAEGDADTIENIIYLEKLPIF